MSQQHSKHGSSRSRRRRALAPTKEPREPLDSHEALQVQESFLAGIAEAASLCREMEAHLRQHSAPELETIIKVYRVLVLKLSAELRAVPELRHLVTTLMKPVMDWARLEEKRKQRELAEQKLREEAAARQAAKENGREGALRPETAQVIEHELRLF